MKFTNIAACSAALLSTSALARSTVTVTEYTCTSTSSLARNTVTSTITVYCPPSSDGPVPTATDAPTDVAPTDVAPTGTDVSPTDVAPTGSAPTDDAPTSAAPTDDAPTNVPVPSDTPDTTYPIKGNTVNCRSGPGTNYPIKKTYAKGTLVTITCQTPGTSIYGNAIWDLTGDGCYVTDYYIKTGTSKYIKPKCDVSTIPDAPAAPAPTQGTGGGSGNAGPMKNDYPYGASTCGDVDKWYYYACQCTSFVAWRINERLGINFHNKYKGAAWGNADSWDEAARATGFKVDGNPVPGCIAQSNAGSAGHVAWVSAVNGDTVTIEEYNYVSVEKYSTRTLPVSSFNYIHLKY